METAPIAYSWFDQLCKSLLNLLQCRTLFNHITLYNKIHLDVLRPNRYPITLHQVALQIAEAISSHYQLAQKLSFLARLEYELQQQLPDHLLKRATLQCFHILYDLPEHPTIENLSYFLLIHTMSCHSRLTHLQIRSHRLPLLGK